ncbi:hypothetical protein [Legionella sp. CNM-4043-24]|uniref:hypothetical protein n=1 Tax=Legionella sp. CNM-4043-24 TaxID=3421646 RepID=UPI00403B305B
MMYVQFLFIAAVLMFAKLVNAAPVFSPYADSGQQSFTLRHADESKQAADKHPFGGLTMWSVTRDAPCTDRVCSASNPQTQPFLRIS